MTHKYIMSYWGITNRIFPFHGTDTDKYNHQQILILKKNSWLINYEYEVN